MSFSRKHRPPDRKHATLAELREGEQAVLERLDLPEDNARRLMELGFLPGQIVSAAHSAPSGDPRVFRVDGSEVALRRETARHLKIRVAD
ncbi:MAG: ferrous iron transport protein A [Bryobacterales bacterium]|nr:ferrous iron transport protein A [Bryobacterales bacterium]